MPITTENTRDQYREIEIKLRCTTHEAVKQQLQTMNAQDIGLMCELNEFFDTPDQHLSNQRLALRVRTIEYAADGRREALITVKGGGLPADIQNRPSIDISAEPVDCVSELFLRLGYRRTGAFEKRRHSWLLEGVRVELDRLPFYGLFIELEGPDEALITRIQRKLGLDAVPVERTSYHSMLMQYLAAHPEAHGVLRFPKEEYWMIQSAD
jgi:predicted adenylyl cyclase CyaB